MIEPYWMALFNFICLSIATAFFLIFRYLYPKKKINFLLLIIVTSILPIISVFRIGVYESSDFTYHIYRAMSFYDSLRDGIIIPSWSGNLNAGYGYPVFIFLYNVPYYLFAFFHTLGFTFIFSERLILSLSYIFSGLFMFLLLKKIIKNDLAAFTGAIFYLFTPYHLVDLHFRVSIGEVIAFSITPIIFYLIVKLEEKNTLVYFALLSLLFGVLFLTHPDQFVYYSGLFLAYLIFKWVYVKNIKFNTIIIYLTANLTGLIISSYNWLSRLTLSQYTGSQNVIDTPLAFVKPIEFLISPWRYGLLFQGHSGELSYVFGYSQLFILFLSLIMLFKNTLDKKIKKELLFWVFITIAMIFSLFSYSKSFWDLIPLSNLTQFTYRVLHPLTFSISIVCALVVNAYKKHVKLIYILAFITITYTLLNWGNRGMIPSINDQALYNNLSKSTAQGEGNGEAKSIWWTSKTETWPTEIPSKHMLFIDGSGYIKELYRNSISHTYVVYASTSSTLLENTFYFPGWRITANNNQVKIIYNSSTYPARMVFKIPKGVYFINVNYDDIMPIKIAKMLSVLTVISILVYLSYYLFKNKWKQ